MFGFIGCNRAELTQEEKNRYQSVYCGLCRNIRNRYGWPERLSLSYDMTFLILFLSSLYEPKETAEKFRCGIHPLSERTGIRNKFTDYAADMTVLLAYYKCLDDWKDEKNRARRLYGNMLKKDIERIEKRYPRQCRSIRESLIDLEKIENLLPVRADRAVNCSGKMMTELFVYEEDFWSSSLRSFGYELGRFIYLMDASIDYEEDMKKHNYNPLPAMKKTPDEMEPVLKMPLGNCMEIFEKLPLIQDEHLLRNILYSGVWQQYFSKMRKKVKKHG